MSLKTDCVNWIKEYFKTTNGINAIIGISGGKDSTVAAGLCCEALGPDHVIGVSMPNGVQSDLNDVNRVIDFLKIKKIEVNILDIYNSVLDKINIKNPSSQTLINLPPRIRMTVLYAIGQSNNARVVNTSNFDESLMGYSTLWGDNVGDFAPLKNLHVSQVIEIGKNLGFPYDLIHKVPSDGLTGRTDEEVLGFTYQNVEEMYKKLVSDNFTFSINESRAYKKMKDNSWKYNMIKIPSYIPENN